MRTCLIEPVMLPRQFQTRSVYAYQTCPLRLGYSPRTIWEPISDEFEGSEAMCRDKRHQWLKKMHSCFGISILCIPSPIYILICYITTPRPPGFSQTLQCSWWIYSGKIIMLLQGRLVYSSLPYRAGECQTGQRRRGSTWRWERWNQLVTPRLSGMPANLVEANSTTGYFYEYPISWGYPRMESPIPTWGT